MSRKKHKNKKNIDSKIIKRGRGRPPKVKQLTNAELPVCKKKRGRPTKINIQQITETVNDNVLHIAETKSDNALQLIDEIDDKIIVSDNVIIPVLSKKKKGSFIITLILIITILVLIGFIVNLFLPKGNVVIASDGSYLSMKIK